MKTQNIPVFQPYLQEEETAACAASLKRGWLGMGADVGRFEEALASVLGLTDRRVVAVSTGHAALHLGLLLCGIGPGDEVITPAFNNVADLQAIIATGAAPVFCDIDPVTLCLDVDKAEMLIGPRTKCIIPMDYGCCLADHDAVGALAARHGLRVLHDAAHSLGSFSRGRRVGSFSDLCMFSFDPVKTITCIDGGALVVRTEEEAARLHEMRLIGMRQPAKVMYGNARAWTYDVQRPGFRYHMSNLHAALGLVQLARLEDISSSRRRSCTLYSSLLAGIAEVAVPATDFSGVTPFLYYIRVPAECRDPLRDALRADGIDTGIHWQPGHEFTLFREARRGDLPVTERLGREIVSLPLHSFMPDAMIERVCRGVRSFFGGA